MDLGKLVRAKMKEMKKDLSGEYIDEGGKHLEMKKCDAGYTIGYGGGKKSIECDVESAMKLAKHCRKLEEKKDEKELALKKLGQDSWTKKSDYWEKYYKQDYYGKVLGHQGDTDWKWDLMDETMHTVANGREKTPESAKAKCDAAAKSRM